MNHQLVRGLFSPEEIAVLRAYCDDALRAETFAPGIVPYYDGHGDDRRLIRIERLAEHLEADTGLPLLARCLELVRRETGRDAHLFKDKINFRHPGAAGFGAHQDAAAGWTDYSPIFHSIALFVRDTDAAYGGFEFSVEDPGAAFYPNVNGQIGRELFESFARCDVEARAGDAIFFDSFAPHRSHANRSGEVVPHLILTFNPAEHGDRRDAYYASKLANMRGGDGGYEFKLFDFGDATAQAR